MNNVHISTALLPYKLRLFLAIFIGVACCLFLFFHAVLFIYLNGLLIILALGVLIVGFMRINIRLSSKFFSIDFQDLFNQKIDFRDIVAVEKVSISFVGLGYRIWKDSEYYTVWQKQQIRIGLKSRSVYVPYDENLWSGLSEIGMGVNG